MSGSVAVLHHPRSFFPLDLYQAVGDTKLIWVLVEGDEHDPALRRLLRRLGGVVEIPAEDYAAAAALLAEHRPDGLVSFVDDHLVLAAELAARLNLTYHEPRVARTLADKERQRATLTRAGVAGPRSWEVPQDPGQLAARAREIAYPAVLKPARGSGSRGIEALAGAEDLLARHTPGSVQFVEELMPDDPARDGRFASYLSVESVLAQGARSHVALTGRFALAPPFRETGNFIPAVSSPSLHAELLALTDAAIDALEITTGVLHTEIKLTPDGPRVIEVNGRLGGRPPFVLRTVSDLNLFLVACQVALGCRVELDAPRCDGVGFWRMLQPPVSSRRVRSIEGLEQLETRPEVRSIQLHRAPGASVDWREGTDGAVVTIRGHVADHSALAELIAGIDAAVRIEYED